MRTSDVAESSEKGMRVLQMGLTCNHGGSESFVLNYAQALNKYGITFDYVDLQGMGLADSNEILSEGSIIYTLNDYRRHPVLAVKQIKEIVQNGHYPCVHVNMQSAACLSPVIGALCGKAGVIVHSHNTQALGLIRKILHYVNSRLLQLLPVTRLACGKCAGDWMYGNKKYEIIPNAINCEKFQFCSEDREAVRKQLRISDKTILLGFVGRLSYQKNPTYLPQILYALRRVGMCEVKLAIVGGGEFRSQVEQLAIELGVIENIIFVGCQEDTQRWYSAMDALVLPSFWEGVPLVAVEAQASGLPCFLSNHISNEISLTDLVSFCELSESAENWAFAIRDVTQRQTERYKYADDLKKTSYSLSKSAGRLRDIYRMFEQRKVMQQK